MTTRLIELENYSKEQVRFYAKIEADNPTGSMKDRMVGAVLDILENKKELQHAMTIVEASSGNTGIALAKVGVERGYSVVICTPDSNVPEKRKLMRQYGADVREFNTQIDTEADINAARELGKQKGWYFFNQFENPYHTQAYYNSFGAEIIEQLKEMNVVIDTVVGGVGTGGSLVGLIQRLREEHNPLLKIYAVGPKQSPSKIEGLHPGHIRGYFKIWKDRPTPFEENHILIDNEEAIKRAIELSSREKLEVGPSSGAVLEAALNLPLSGNCLLLFCDNGNRYQNLYSKY